MCILALRAAAEVKMSPDRLWHVVNRHKTPEFKVGEIAHALCGFSAKFAKNPTERPGPHEMCRSCERIYESNYFEDQGRKHMEHLQGLRE
jgi:hypothetical protein